MVSTCLPPLILAVVSLSLLIATFLSSSENKSLQLGMLLTVTLILSAISAALEWRIRKKFCNDGDLLTAVCNGLKLPRANRWLIIAPSIFLFILLFARILFIDHFLTDPAALDFGPKYCDPEKPNISFTGESSFGHWIQGVIASLFAYPAVKGVLARLWRDKPLLLALPRAWLLLLVDFASFTFTFYPLYNFIKRLTRTPDTFATSSYMNNGCEWVIGALVGMSLGILISSITTERLVGHLQKIHSREKNEANEELRNMESYSFAKSEEPPGCFSRLCLGVAKIFGVFFMTSVFGAALMTGITWNNCEND